MLGSNGCATGKRLIRWALGWVSVGGLGWIAQATAPLEWSLVRGRDPAYHPDADVNVSVPLAPRVDREYSFATTYNYLAELRQIAAFLQRWQVQDPSSPDYGGIIEAEGGSLGNVIQTDNTLEAIVVWSTYAVVFQDTATFATPIRLAWHYAWRYPAWREEGGPGEDYYRDHNCAWGLWAHRAYAAAYGDSAHAPYADTCAAYMVAHPLPFNASGAFRWINPFVTGWMAGNLYLYAEERGDLALADTAVGMGRRVKEWIEQDPPSRLTEERWAMSSGTAVWGVCSSVFRRFPQEGASWVATYGPLVDTFQPWRNAPDDGYDWDNAWNVAYANAHHAMFLVSADAQYAANFQALVDTLLSYDTDDDGGIPATTRDPVTEDMTWISSYLALMGVSNLSTHLPPWDGGVLRLLTWTPRPPYQVGESLLVACTFANFGTQGPLPASLRLELRLPSGAYEEVVREAVLGLGENLQVEARWYMTEAGPYGVRASTASPGDASTSNDSLSVVVPVRAVAQVRGTLWSSLEQEPIQGVVVASFVGEGQVLPQDTAQADLAGRWEVEVPVGPCRLEVWPRLPYPVRVEDVEVVPRGEEVRVEFDHAVDVVIVDDDAGAPWEAYTVASCESVGLEARVWDTSEGPPSMADMARVPGIPLVWLTGETTVPTLDAAAQESLAGFVRAGGGLMISGQHAVEACGQGCLFQEVLPVAFGGNTADHILDLDQADGFNAGYRHIGTAGFGSANNQRAQDILLVREVPGVTAFPFVSYAPGQVAGVRFEGGGGRRIVLGFGLEGVGLPSQPQGFMPRAVLIARSVNWLKGLLPAEVPPLPLVRVWPNPARDRIFLLAATEGPVRACLYDMAGRRVAHARLQGSGPRCLDVSALAPGAYTLTLEGIPWGPVLILP